MQRPRARIRSPVGVPVTQAVPGSRASGAPILAVNDIVKRFGDGAEALLAVDGVSFDVGEGEFVSLIGPSGCGKSTLFNIIGGLVADYDGRIEVDGESVSGTHAAFGMVFNVGNFYLVTINQLATLVVAAAASTSSIVHVPYEDAYPPAR